MSVLIQYRAILPKRDPIPRPDIQATMSHFRAFATDSINYLKQYPAKPLESRYRRTGELRRGWKRVGPERRSDLGDIAVDIINEAEDEYGRRYAAFVQGPRSQQQNIMRRYGWRSVSDINRRIWPRYRNRIRRSLVIGRRNVVQTRF